MRHVKYYCVKEEVANVYNTLTVVAACKRVVPLLPPALSTHPSPPPPPIIDLKVRWWSSGHTICNLLVASLSASEIINQIVVSGGGILFLHGAHVVNPLQLTQTGALQPVPVCCFGNGVFPFLEHWRNRAGLSPASIISTLQGYTAEHKMTNRHSRVFVCLAWDAQNLCRFWVSRPMRSVKSSSLIRRISCFQ